MDFSKAFDKGQTIRKLMGGGGGEGEEQKKIRAREN